MKLLVTGSRSWDDRASVARVIWAAYDKAHAAGTDLVVVHGTASGADDLAAQIVRAMAADGCRVREERHPADWTACGTDCPPGHRKARRVSRREYCPTAGHRRNAEMVAAGADLAAAFIRDNSPGATHCLRLIEAAGIPVVITRSGDHEPTEGAKP